VKHEKIKVPIDTITVARGKIGQHNVARENARRISNRISIGALGLGITLLVTLILRWIL
jgi:hypothetical protein